MKTRACKFCGILLNSTNSPNHRWLCCCSCRTIRERERYPQRREKLLEYQRQTRIKNKKAMIEAYGGKCACCGESQFEFLTVEHINKDGAKHRKEIGGGKRIHTWLKKNNYPKEGFTVLCFNCNAASFYYGECPHKKSLLARMLSES